MENKVTLKNRSIYKVNLFYLITLIWAIITQFLPIDDKLYQYVALLIPVSIYLILNKKDIKRILKLNPLNKQSLLLIPIIWIFMLPLSLFIITVYNYLFGDALANIIFEETTNNLISTFIFTAFTPAIIEEVFMRGIILDGYRYKNIFTASIINGLMFGMLHLNTFQFSHTFVAGIVASFLVYSTNSIYSSMLIHLINNSFPILMDLIIPIQSTAPDTKEELNLLFFGTIVILSLIVVCSLIYKLASINNIKLKNKKRFSKEKIFNKPLKISILIFICFSLILSFMIKQT
ncbi:CPBP family intramembrane metalloprotease [Anaerosalibacter bizertensis]|uniref:CPBP family intramembrane metalloprotease n=3 Tax=Anaerosalibacter bizertensis TaxID=932217 RepID=A0A844FFK4_9FIRM|nr:type II CAAX endopeptidase family protein [Anaerosalibacter bizertensis]MBV1817248.1 CPBP family intramembrane metalloprotease [Bacteroidales bacterium MSK.15.36]MBU5293590.1 CPBP family intramembrane metalloprotease [Anaerosalibacter bizertensis]MCG4564349.1 CPBP family intramembrane metalloprotease [Anaerosalibacter bizertensis]MCG4583495.1 CPBP family intramembrane metalloprotease [Anaerosalibacter bizertensis]MSS42769.1 CPBP family intramembrane metalloprotease [Anaerosalibacter bizerte